MKYRLMGRTGVRLSEIGFGCMTFGTWHLNIGNTDQRAANSIVNECLDEGVNFFDTADVYSEGRSEEILGNALGKRRRDVVVASKCGARTKPGPNSGAATRSNIMNAIEGSLRRLKTDYIDLYQIHFWDELTCIDETLRALDDLVSSGKVRYLGCSNFAAWQITKALWSADGNGWARFETMQMQYNLLRRDIENEHIALCTDQNIGLLVWSPLMGGWLSGKFRRNKPVKKSWRRGDTTNPLNALEFMNVDAQRAYQVIDAIDQIASARNATVAQISLAWLLAKQSVTSIIVGSRNLKQLSENLAVGDIVLTQDEVERLDLASRVEQTYPYNTVGFVRSMR
jgi:aryl-alcohol dehydrogenase-like predicted oxidoreductase